MNRDYIDLLLLSSSYKITFLIGSDRIGIKIILIQKFRMFSFNNFKENSWNLKGLNIRHKIWNRSR